MRLGLVGYGFGGRVFHTPFIQAAQCVELTAIVARSPDKVAQIHRDLPGVAVYGSLTEMIEGNAVDKVAVTTPPATHKPLVLEAIAAGLHVICDKPFAPSLPDAQEMADAAKAKGVLLNVFHNRRWDPDLRTVQSVIETGRLGTVTRVHSRLDANDWATLETGPTGGLLRDHGSHFVDQMLHLLGPAASVDAQVDYVDTPEGPTDASYAIHLRHAGGAQSYIVGSKVNYMDEREIRAYGDKGTFKVNGTDVQARRAIAGEKPADDPEGWGIEPIDAWGTLFTEAGSETIPSVQSNTADLYTAFAKAAQDGGPGPVPVESALHTVQVLDAAREAARVGRTIDIN